MASFERSRRQSLRQAFLAALDGVCYAVVQERNMKIDTAGAFVLLAWDLCIRPALSTVSLTIFVCCIVFAVELVNTATERVVDLASHDKQHPLAKYAKDTAAGASLVASIGALAVGGYAAMAEWPWHWYLSSNVNASGAVMSLIGLMFLCFVVLRAWSRRKLYM